MKYDIPDEWVRIPKPKSEVEYRRRYDLEVAIDKVCKFLIDDCKIFIKLPDEISDQIIDWAMKEVNLAYILPDRPFNEAVAAICAHAASVGEILIQILIGTDTDQIVENIHRLSKTIRVEDLPEGIEEMIHVFLESFSREGEVR